jgi:hypothetical protein
MQSHGGKIPEKRLPAAIGRADFLHVFPPGTGLRAYAQSHQKRHVKTRCRHYARFGIINLLGGPPMEHNETRLTQGLTPKLNNSPIITRDYKHNRCLNYARQKRQCGWPMIQIVMQQCAISVEKSIAHHSHPHARRTLLTSAPVAVTTRGQYGYALTKNNFTFTNTLKKRNFI